MKKRNLIAELIMLLFLTSYGFSQEVQLGDSLQDIMDGLSTKDLIGSDDLGLWPENEYYVYDKDGLSVILSMNFYPFGVISNEGGESFLLSDFDGDSVLDMKSRYLFIPPWIVGKNSKGTNNGKDIKVYLNLLRNAYQSDPRPVDSDGMQEGTEWIVEAAKDVYLNDRYYSYLIYLYSYLYNRGEYIPAYLCIDALSQEFKNEKESLMIYFVETAIQMDDLDFAKQIDDFLVHLYPDFIPGKVYRYLLSNDEAEKTDILDDLLSEHGDHWLVIEKIKKTM